MRLYSSVGCTHQLGVPIKDDFVDRTTKRKYQVALNVSIIHAFPRMLPATVENIEEAWLPAAEAELTALAAEAEKVDRMPDSLLLRPPPPGGVDLITPDPRYACVPNRP